MMSTHHPALERIAARYGDGLLELLSSTLGGADLTALLLEVARQRAGAVTPKGVLAQFERDRFVRPATVDGRRMIQTECLALESIGETFDVVTLSPLSPLGTHSVIADVHQHRVVSTVRGSEVAADPTNGLALEAARRRRDHLRSNQRSSEFVQLACVQRVTRAQRFEGPMSFAHFSLLGAVLAGRDTGGSSFERTALLRLLRSMVNVLRDAGADETSVSFSDFDGGFGGLVRDVSDELVAEPADNSVRVLIDQDRNAGRAYYPSVCFKLHARFGDEEIEFGDGGFVPWTQRLLANSKERLLIGGIGLDRLAIVRPSAVPL